MDVSLILQPFQDETSLHDALTSALQSDKFTSLDIIVAWTKNSGLSRLEAALASFNARGDTSTRLITGLDEGGASREGLEAALLSFDTAFLLHDAASGTFHPKVYFFSGPDQALLIVGSGNLTAGGLYFNYEVAQVTRLDRANDVDNELRGRVAEWIDRLLDDDTCMQLSSPLIARLDEQDAAVLKREGERASRDAGDDVDTRAVSHKLLRSIFGSSKHPKRRDPQGRRRPATVRVDVEKVYTYQPEIEADYPPQKPDAILVARWAKRMSASDCGRPRAGSNTTSALRFVKAQQNIDQTTYFREFFFGDLAWTPDNLPGRERTSATFDITVDGVSRGVHSLLIKHDGRRESGQNNFTTDLKWGTLAPVLRQHDAVGEWAIFDKFSDGHFSITIQHEEPIPRFVQYRAISG